MEKQCPKCKQVKPFYDKHKNITICVDCHKEEMKNNYYKYRKKQLKYKEKIKKQGHTKNYIIKL